MGLAQRHRVDRDGDDGGALGGVRPGVLAAVGVHADRYARGDGPGDDRRQDCAELVRTVVTAEAEGEREVAGADVDPVQSVDREEVVQLVEGSRHLHHEDHQRLVRATHEPADRAATVGRVPGRRDDLASVLGIADVGDDHAMGAEVERSTDVGERGAAGADQRHRTGRADRCGDAGQVGLGDRTVLQVDDDVVGAGPGQDLRGHGSREQAPETVGSAAGGPRRTQVEIVSHATSLLTAGARGRRPRGAPRRRPRRRAG